MAEVILTKDNFNAEVINETKPVLIDFWATWCGPCRMLAPIIEEIAKENEDKVKVCKVNVDDEPELSAAFQISSIPTLVVMKNGKPVASSVGYRPKDAVLALLNKE